MEALADLLGFVAGIPAIVGLILAAALIFLSSSWRLSLTALMVQYLLVSAVLSRSIVTEIVIVKILTGVLVVPILYMSAQYAQDGQREDRGHLPFLGLRAGWSAGPLGLPVRMLVVLAIALTVLRFYGQFASLMPILESGAPTVSPDVALVVLWLAAVGLVGLVLSAEPLRVAPALLTLLSAFDLVYTLLDSNLAVAGAYGAMTLLVALALSYLALGKGLSVAPQSQAVPGQGDIESAGPATLLTEEAAEE
jgi:hypothetical protein